MSQGLAVVFEGVLVDARRGLGAPAKSSDLAQVQARVVGTLAPVEVENLAAVMNVPRGGARDHTVERASCRRLLRQKACIRLERDPATSTSRL